jgi:hypothetical protein
MYIVFVYELEDDKFYEIMTQDKMLEDRCDEVNELATENGLIDALEALYFRHDPRSAILNLHERLKVSCMSCVINSVHGLAKGDQP